MPVSFWIFLSVCLVSFVSVFKDHGETWREFIEAKGKERYKLGARVVALWFVAILSLIGTLVLGLNPTNLI